MSEPGFRVRISYLNRFMGHGSNVHEGSSTANLKKQCDNKSASKNSH